MEISRLRKQPRKRNPSNIFFPQYKILFAKYVTGLNVLFLILTSSIHFLSLRNQRPELNPSFHLHGLTAFNDEMTGLVNEGRALDIIYLNFSKSFETVSEQADEVWLK